MAKNSFVLYYNYKDQLEDLTNEQMGELLRAIFDYEIDDEMPEFSSGEVKIAFKFIKKDLDANKGKYEETCQKNRENAGMRWQKNNATAYDRSIGNANECDRIRTDAKNADNDNDNDNVNVNDNDLVSKKVSKARPRVFDEIIADFTQYEPLRLALGEFIKMRKLIKKPLTSHSLQLCLTERNTGLFDLSGGDHDLATQIVNQSIRNSWQGLFPLRDTKPVAVDKQPQTANPFLNMALGAEVPR